MKSKFFIILLLFIASCSTGILKDDGDSFADIAMQPISKQPKRLLSVINNASTRATILKDKLYAYRLARFAIKTYPADTRFTLSLQKLCFLLADIHSKNTAVQFAARGASFYKQGHCNKNNHESAYYHALNLGMILKEKGMLALDKLPHMHKSLLCAVNSPAIDHGGPLRALGMLYLKAPSWPQGIGDIDKALELLKKAASQYPDFPENNIFYAEALIENDQPKLAGPLLKKTRLLLSIKKWGLFYNQRWLNIIKKLEEKLD